MNQTPDSPQLNTHRISVPGISGKTYNFYSLRFEDKIPEGYGVYITVLRNEKGYLPSFVYVGPIESTNTTFDDLNRVKDSKKQGANLLYYGWSNQDDFIHMAKDIEWNHPTEINSRLESYKITNPKSVNEIDPQIKNPDEQIVIPPKLWFPVTVS